MVPFLDGTDPTAGNVRFSFADDCLTSYAIMQGPLPLLSSADVVGNLQDRESRRYYRGYRGGAGAFPAEAARKAYILQAIGGEVL
jgi:hypothetical protein